MFRRFLSSVVKGPLESIPRDCREYHPIDILNAAQKALTRLQKENLILRKQLKKEQDLVKSMKERER